MARSDARDVSMRICYARLMGGDDGFSSIDMIEDKPLSDADEAYIQNTLQGLSRMEGELDEVIARHLVGWTIERIARVDLCIMRLAAYEILAEDDVPDSAAINEAVELARTYSTDDSPAFVNGVLGAIVREKEAKA